MAVPGSQSKDKRHVRGEAQAISVLSYQLYELLMNMSQTEYAHGFMDEENFCVQQEAGGCYLHDGSNETWKFLSMCNQKIIMPLKFCIMRTRLIISTTCFACYCSYLPTPILHLCLSWFYNRFCKVESTYLTSTMNDGLLHTQKSDAGLESLAFRAKIPVDNDCVCLCVCAASLHDVG